MQPWAALVPSLRTHATHSATLIAHWACRVRVCNVLSPAIPVHALEHYPSPKQDIRSALLSPTCRLDLHAHKVHTLAVVLQVLGTGASGPGQRMGHPAECLCDGMCKAICRTKRGERIGHASLRGFADVLHSFLHYFTTAFTVAQSPPPL